MINIKKVGLSLAVLSALSFGLVGCGGSDSEDSSTSETQQEVSTPTTSSTASKYLNKLANDGLLRKEKLGTGNYYINERLMKILTLKE